MKMAPKLLLLMLALVGLVAGTMSYVCLANVGTLSRREAQLKVFNTGRAAFEDALKGPDRWADATAALRRGIRPRQESTVEEDSSHH